MFAKRSTLLKRRVKDYKVAYLSSTFLQIALQTSMELSDLSRPELVVPFPWSTIQG